MAYEKIICSFFSKKNWQNFRLKVKLIATVSVHHYAYYGEAVFF